MKQRRGCYEQLRSAVLGSPLCWQKPLQSPAGEPASERSTGTQRRDWGNAATALVDSPGVVMRCSGEVSQELTLHSRPNATTNPHGITDGVGGMPVQNRACQEGTLSPQDTLPREVKKRANPDTFQTQCKISLFTRADLQ